MMAVTVKYTCNGCNASTEGTEPLRKEFFSVTGRSYGFGSYRTVNSAASVAPDGWIAFDPHTQACYCPKCWASIEEGIG